VKARPPLAGHDGAARGHTAILPPTGTGDFDGIEAGEGPCAEVEGEGGVFITGAASGGGGRALAACSASKRAISTADRGGAGGVHAEGEFALPAEDPVGISMAETTRERPYASVRVG